MSKRHTVYVLVDVDGKFIDAFLSYSEASRNLRSGQKIITLLAREDY